MGHAPSHLKLVAGLDLARRSDYSALVLMDVEADRLTVSAALRLPQAPLRQQFALIAPRYSAPEASSRALDQLVVASSPGQLTDRLQPS